MVFFLRNHTTDSKGSFSFLSRNVFLVLPQRTSQAHEKAGIQHMAQHRPVTGEGSARLLGSKTQNSQDLLMSRERGLSQMVCGFLKDKRGEVTLLSAKAHAVVRCQEVQITQTITSAREFWPEQYRLSLWAG